MWIHTCNPTYTIPSTIITHYTIIQIHNNVMWDSQYSTKHSQIFPTFGLDVGNIREYSMEYYESHKTLLWIWIMLWSITVVSYCFLIVWTWDSWCLHKLVHCRCRQLDSSKAKPPTLKWTCSTLWNVRLDIKHECEEYILRILLIKVQ